MSKKIKKEITNNELYKDTKALIQELQKMNFDPRSTQVIAIGRGGFVPAQFVAYALNIRNISSVQSVFYENFEKKEQNISGIFFLDYEDFDHFIIVDDIYDTGETMDTVVDVVADAIETLSDKTIKITPAVVYTRFKKKEMARRGVKFGKKIKKLKKKDPWLVFPWDTMQENL
jgi:hypoxanthine phosphoribosyltransferase